MSTICCNELIVNGLNALYRVNALDVIGCHVDVQVKFVHCTLNKLKLIFMPCATLSHFTSVRGEKPRDGLGIFTDRDQRSIFFGFEFGESVFFWY